MIRPYKSSDKPRLLEIFKLNTPEYFDCSEEKDFLEYLEENGDTYLTIEINKEIVGGIGYYVNESDSSGRITWVFFAPDHSGQGLGRQAVAYCLSILNKDKRVEKFMVRTSQHAYRFFEKFGYQISRIEKDYWGQGLDLYEMEMARNC